jgi:hypothetical protein
LADLAGDRLPVRIQLLGFINNLGAYEHFTSDGHKPQPSMVHWENDKHLTEGCELDLSAGSRILHGLMTLSPATRLPAVEPEPPKAQLAAITLSSIHAHAQQQQLEQTR